MVGPPEGVKISIGAHEMSNIGGFDGFGLPGFDTGGRKLRASGTVRAFNMLLDDRPRGVPKCQCLSTICQCGA